MVVSFISILVFSIYHTSEAEEKQNGFARRRCVPKVNFLFFSYSTCVVYTKTIIHLSRFAAR